MFPTVVKPVAKVAKSTYRPRLCWHPQSALIAVQMPQKNPQAGITSRKRFKVRFTYIDGATGQEKTKSIIFGSENQFIDHKDEALRNERFNRLHHQNDPFHQNYWRLHLLNTQPSIQKAYIKFLTKLTQYSCIQPQPVITELKKPRAAKQLNKTQNDIGRYLSRDKKV